MIAKTYSAIPFGFEGKLIEIEGDMNRGLPSFNIVGLGSKTISEAKERVKSALSSSGFSFPDKRLTINLAPAELSKDGAHLDLGIALTILALSNQLHQQDLDHRLFVGELSLSGHLRPVHGIINIIEAAKNAGFKEVFIPPDNLSQASLIDGITIHAAPSLKQLFLHLKNQQPLPTIKNVVKNTKTDTTSPILDHIIGQEFAKRALAIAIAGHHNILLSGPPGTGKTLLAKVAANLLPPLTPEEQISVTKIHSMGGSIDNIISDRPFRCPHHSASLAAMLGNSLGPGEISLAHLGVLFLDELPEYPRSLLEALRQPLEDKQISISRAKFKTTYPADFMLIATMNPCPCGYSGDPTHPCTCTITQINNYRKKLSGPLSDRIDMRINVAKVKASHLPHPTNITHEHNVVKNTITEALRRQRLRYGRSDFYNASLSSHQISTLLHLSPGAEQLLCSASERLNLSTRSYFKIIKVAATIADLSASDLIEENHLAEALSYRTDLPQP